MTQLISHRVIPAGQWTQRAGQCVMAYDDRFLRRKVLQTAAGEDFLVDLAHTSSVNDGDAFALNDGRLIAVIAAKEDLLQITAENLLPIAWHIGNRHCPAQIETARILIKPDHVLRDLMQRLGADVTEIMEPFFPEGGAYGHGRTHGHDHSHQHGPDGSHGHHHHD